MRDGNSPPGWERAIGILREVLMMIENPMAGVNYLDSYKTVKETSRQVGGERKTKLPRW
jgi:hypothetical protein